MVALYQENFHSSTRGHLEMLATNTMSATTAVDNINGRDSNATKHSSATWKRCVATSTAKDGCARPGAGHVWRLQTSTTGQLELVGLFTLKTRHHHGAYLPAQRIVVIQPKVFRAVVNTIQERQTRILLTVKECSLTENHKMHFVIRSHVRNKHVKTK